MGTALEGVIKGRSFSTPQTQKAKPNQIKNRAGGYVFEADDWIRLDRFLIIGTEGGTFYAGQKELTEENAKHVAGLINVDGMRVLDRTLEISESGRAQKNDYAIFVLAMLCAWGNTQVKRKAFEVLPRICRTGSHILQFVALSKQFRGWGRLMTNGISKWYLDKSLDQMLFQATKYANRHGWTHKDVMRLAHPLSKLEPDKNLALAYIAGKADEKQLATLKEKSTLVEILNSLDSYISAEERIAAIQKGGLQREHIPTEWTQDNTVLEMLTMQTPLTALIRDLSKLTARGLLTERADLTKYICDRLSNKEEIRRARIHPMAVMVAAKTYEQGRGEKGTLTWVPSHRILLALDEAFNLSFGNVEPTNKKILVSIDFSGSMTYKNVSDVPNLNARTASLAMSLIQVNSEPNLTITAFTDSRRGCWPLEIKAGQSLDQVMKYADTQKNGGTDGSQPILYALGKNEKFDAIVIYTDNETWAGEEHVFEAMQSYHRTVNPNAKLIVVGTAATNSSLVNPTPADMNTYDVVGFDGGISQVINSLILG